MLVQTATENQISEENVGDVKADPIVEGANGYITVEVDRNIKKKTSVISNILSYAGGFLVSYFKWL